MQLHHLLPEAFSSGVFAFVQKHFAPVVQGRLFGKGRIDPDLRKVHFPQKALRLSQPVQVHLEIHLLAFEQSIAAAQCINGRRELRLAGPVVKITAFELQRKAFWSARKWPSCNRYRPGSD